MVNRSRQNVGYPWLSEGQRTSLYAPSSLIPVLKEIAYKLDSESFSGDCNVTIKVVEGKIVIEISKI